MVLFIVEKNKLWLTLSYLPQEQNLKSVITKYENCHH